MKKRLIIFIILGLMFSGLMFSFFVNFLEDKNEGIITLTFDDGYATHYDFVFKEMQKYNFPGTLFLVANWSGYFEDKQLISFEEAREMQNEGWEIGSHSLNHERLTALSEEELINNLEKSKEILEEEGFSIFSLAYPYGDYNADVANFSRVYYSALRPLERGFNFVEEPNFYELKSMWVREEDSSQKVCFWIKNAKEQKLWLILDFHNVGEEKTSWDFSEEKFKEILSCIDDENIKVRTIKGVLDNEKRI
jgi:hypothetical protein